ncbi:hypothetical protein DMB66_16150 [Actinoplanes sp. ATCC 53533]|uniref:hypothetical protein n=1 Tax=Actinoplanes sp. ATCC 53533 TaxID=1288362 RepID=UPI000F7A99BF|nr:hypothetical protein [Actinoplanes sp. ATCC 53533]RSM65393.1 hypothetical protein DMB66_16150 [Actinoplanes sp. ATCC 53533]
MILRLPSVLSAQTLQLALRASGELESDGQSAVSVTGGLPALRIDLSQIQFAEFTALAQILLLTEAAARDRRPVHVELPRTSPVPDDIDRVAEARLHQRRLHCLRFLRATGFTAAIRLPHLAWAQVTPTLSGAGPAGDADAMDPVETELWEPTWEKPETDIRRHHVKRRVLPFRWIPAKKGEDLFRSDEIVNVIRGLCVTGLKERDAQRLANSIVFELVENVAMHASAGTGAPPHALVGALVVDESLRRALLRLRGEIVGVERAVPATPPGGLQLLVGDSGRGLVQTLQPHATPEDADRLPARGSGSWSGPQSVALWSLDRRSTSAGSREEIRGTRGLWRVREVVRRYGGSLIIHTRDALAGYAFTGEVTTPLYGESSWSAPGTLVEASIVWPDAEITPVVPATTAGREHVPLSWIRLHPTSVSGSLEGQAAPDPNAGLLLSIDGGRTQHMTHESLVAVLSRAASLARHNTVAVLVTGADPVTVDAAVDAIAHPPEGAAPSSPFLLIDGLRRTIWCGASPRHLELLHRAEHEADPPDQDAEFVALAADYPHLVRIDEGSARLVLHPAAVISQLEEKAAGRLRDALDNGEDIVQTGVFRTPSLNLTDRWFQSDELVERTVGTGVSAFLLAHHLARTLPRPLPLNTRVVQIGPLIRDVATLVADYLPLRDPVYELPDDHPALRLAIPLDRGTPCILCCDVVLSTNRTIKVMRQLIDSDALPVAVVTIIDARRERGPIVVRGVEIQVIALTGFTPREITLDDPTDIIDIDPVFRTQVAEPAAPARRYRWTEDSFLGECVHLPDIVGLGHVARPLERHFSAYFSAAALADTKSQFRDEISAEMLDTIVRWAGSADPVATPEVLRIFHVDSPRDYAAKLAGLVADRLNGHFGAGSLIRPEEIPRAVAGQTYAFPERLSRPPAGGDVILIDWGSFGATTLLQMMRLAAEGGARRIIVLVLLSQMSPHEERALTMMRAVGDPARAEPVPAEIRFITSLSITPMLSGDCTLCELITELRATRRSLNLPHEVASHADALVDVLVARDRTAVILSGLDAFGSPIGTEDAFAFIQLRGRLRDARRDTSRADKLADDLTHLRAAGDNRGAAALIRLLAAERRWLAQLPLSLSQCLKQVSRIAREVAVEDERFHDRLRLQAIVVLAVAGPEDLVRDLPEIWRSALGNPVLLRQLLYELWNALSTTLRHSEEDRRTLRQTVRRCVAIDAGEYPPPEDGKEMRSLLERLLERAEVASDPRNPMDSWAFLRECYVAELYRHPKAETAAINLLVLLDSPPAGPEVLDEFTWDTTRRLWQQISSFVSIRILPALPQLQDFLAGPFAQRFLAGQPVDPAGVADGLREIEALIRQLRGEKANSAVFRNAWRELNVRITRWYDMVIAPGTRAAPEAMLARLVDPCPSNLGTVLDACVAEHPGDVRLDGRLSNGGDQLDVDVFCHRDLLREVTHHILEAAVEGSGPQPRQSANVAIDVGTGAGEVRIRFRLPRMPDAVSKTAAIDRAGRLLSSFDGALQYAEATTGELVITLTLVRWEPHGADGGTT